MNTVQMVSTTYCSLKAASWKRVPTVGKSGQNAHSKDETGMGEELPTAQGKLENQLAVKSSQ